MHELVLSYGVCELEWLTPSGGDVVCFFLVKWYLGGKPRNKVKQV